MLLLKDALEKLVLFHQLLALVIPTQLDKLARLINKASMKKSKKQSSFLQFSSREVFSQKCINTNNFTKLFHQLLQ
jgi:hypothetical protein